MDSVHADFLRRFTKAQLVIRRYVFAQVQDAHAAEDVLQDIAVTLWKKYDEFDRRKSFTKWSLGVAHYAILHSRRTVARSRLKLTENVDEMIIERLSEMGPELEERRTLLRACLRKLPAKQRKIIGMKYERSLSCHDISEKIGATVEAVRTVLCRVRRALLTCIQKGLRVENGAAAQ